MLASRHGAQLSQQHGRSMCSGGRHKHIDDSDFVHIRGDAHARLYTVNMTWCQRVTDAAFVYLRGIHTLNMSVCREATIICTSARDPNAQHVLLQPGDHHGRGLFAPAGIKSLDMHLCNQATITDAAFVHLRGIQELDVRSCSQATITAAAFVHLRGIRILSTDGAAPPLVPLLPQSSPWVRHKSRVLRGRTKQI